MDIYLFDNTAHDTLKPLTLTKPVAELRVGILTISEKWEKALGYEPRFATKEFLEVKYGKPSDGGYYIYGGLLPTKDLVDSIKELKVGQGITKGETLLAARSDRELSYRPNHSEFQTREFEGEVTMIEHPWDIFHLNGKAIEMDWQLLGLKPEVKGNNKGCVIEGDQVYVEEGAEIRHAILNSEEGPIYIGKNAKVLEGSVIRGPFALCEEGVVKMAAKIYGPTTVGPHCKVGGEITNSVLQGYSNKGHDGYMGNSVIGEWCNLGADTNTSNLKNNYGEVRVYSYIHKEPRSTGLQFCGVIMGDHSKTGINTMLNTGTVVGVSANIFGGGFPPKYVPSFSWGGADGLDEFKLDKAFEVAERMMERRGLELSDEDRSILTTISKDNSL